MKAIIFAVVALISLFLVDCLGGKTEQVTARVIGREYMPGHWSYGTDSKGRSTSHYTADDYSLIVEINGEARKIDTNRNGYYFSHEGQPITFSQRRGCMSHAAWLASYYR